MITDATELTVGEIVKEDFHAVEVFQKYNIDFCCGGGKTLAAACNEKNVDPLRVVAEVNEVLSRTSADGRRFDEMPLPELITHIIETHHAYVLRSIPAIEQNAAKVSDVHGGRHPEVKEIASLFGDLKDELLRHMFKEENILFPYINNLAHEVEAGAPPTRSPFGTVQNPINMMEMEHETAGGVSRRISELSANYTPPEDACTTYTILYKQLKEFEADLHTHIHLENNILFPKAVRMEAEAFS